MLLQEQIEEQRKQIHTDSYPMSIGEWISLYEKDEIDIHPEFQRFFRWSSTQKTRLIESILLGIPIPQIFVSQRKDGVWDVVDGLQRLSTIYQFVGILKDENDQLLPPLVLEDTEYLPLLEGKKWEDENEIDSSLTAAQRLIIKRTKIGASIILAESDENSKYELFQRLNTGGLALSEQEIRNSILVMMNNDLYKWMRDLASDENFKTVTALTERQINEQYDMDLVLRFLIFRRLPENDLARIGDINDFMTKKMTEFAQQNSLNLEDEAAAFRTTFRLLYEQAGSDSFHRYDVTNQRFLGKFLVSAFESIALGLAFHYPAIESSPPQNLREKIQQLWVTAEFTESSRSGINSSARMRRVVPLGRRMFAP